jgi:hypothetical protein
MSAQYWRDILLTAYFMQGLRPDVVTPLIPPVIMSYMAFDGQSDCLYDYYVDGNEECTVYTYTRTPDQPFPELWAVVAESHHPLRRVYAMGCYRRRLQGRQSNPRDSLRPLGF